MLKTGDFEFGERILPEMPFIAPAAWRETFRRLVQMTDGQIRFIGLTSMIVGLVLLMVFA